MAWNGRVAGVSSGRMASVVPVKLSGTRGTAKTVAPLPQRTRFEVGEVCSSWLQDGASPAESLLDGNFATFWESDEGNRKGRGKGGPAPWFIIRFTQLDQLKRVGFRISPADENDDALPETCEMLAGPSPRSVVSFAKMDVNNQTDDWQYFEMPPKGDLRLKKKTFVVKLVFRGLRPESEGHVRVRGVSVETGLSGLTRKQQLAKRVGSATPEWLQEDYTFPEPSPDHQSVQTPWNDEESWRKSLLVPKLPTRIPSVSTADIALEAAEDKGIAPVKFWATDGPKYTVEPKALSGCGSKMRPSPEVLALLEKIQGGATPDLRPGSPFFHI